MDTGMRKTEMKKKICAGLLTAATAFSLLSGPAVIYAQAQDQDVEVQIGRAHV